MKKGIFYLKSSYSAVEEEDEKEGQKEKEVKGVPVHGDGLCLTRSRRNQLKNKRNVTWSGWPNAWVLWNKFNGWNNNSDQFNGNLQGCIGRHPSEVLKKGGSSGVSLNDRGEDECEVKELFCELLQLLPYKNEEAPEWVETSRWIKFEETVDQDAGRWSKPRVATLAYHHIKEMQKYLHDGQVFLDLEGTNLYEITVMLMRSLNEANITGLDTDQFVQIILRKRHHQHERKSLVRSASSNRLLHRNRHDGHHGRVPSRNQSCVEFADIREEGPSLPSLAGIAISEDDVMKGSGEFKANERFMRKIPTGAEACNILVGLVEDHILQDPLFVFARLKVSANLGDLTEVPINTRFICIFLAPQRASQSVDCLEIGRAVGAIMADEIFREIAFKASCKHDLLNGINEFLDNVTVMPPCEWDPNIRVEPPPSVPPQLKRRKTIENFHHLHDHSHTNDLDLPPLDHVDKSSTHKDDEDDDEDDLHGANDPTLMRTGRLFGGLVADIKRRYVLFLSDLRDGIHIQCLASVLFLFFAVITSNVTFGGVLAEAIDYNMGIVENILGGALCGAVYCLFSGQPLTLIGSTGPMLVFEVLAYKFCKENEIEYLPFRVWIGLWTGFILLIMVAFDLSSLVRYITKFTEESFALLISLIFIYQAFQNLFMISETSPVHTHTEIPFDITLSCVCEPPNATASNVTISDNGAGITNGTIINVNPIGKDTIPINTNLTRMPSYNINSTVGNSTANCTKTHPDWPSCMDWSTVNEELCNELGGTPVGHGCNLPKYEADVFFFSILLFIGTFLIAMSLKALKTSRFFPNRVRQLVADFAVPIAIAIMLGVDMYVSINTPKLKVPDEFKPTQPNRGWIINPIGNNPWWTVIAAIIPALLATILIFMDQQITAVIVNRKSNKLKKGGGYHLDLLIIALEIALCSVMGLPWFVAATVLSMTHVNSLKVESESAAPGEKPKFLGVREQRVTGFFIYLLIGMAVLLRSFLRFIPMPVLYGVFLYLGVSALNGVEIVQRVLIIFMPSKYQPDYMYLRHVQIRRVHLYTLIQVACLAILWVVKQVKSISIAFPLMVLAMCVVRKFLEKIFNSRELYWLDDLLPGATMDDKNNKKFSVSLPGFSTASTGSIGLSVISDGRLTESTVCSLPRLPTSEDDVEKAEIKETKFTLNGHCEEIPEEMETMLSKEDDVKA